MKVRNIVICAALGALALSAIPYRIDKDEETGAMEIRSLLWAFKKLPPAEGKENDRYYFAMPPSGLDSIEEAEA